MMFRDQYKRLGDYIHQVDVRNRDLAVHDLKGLSMTKEFRESTSNIVGVDLSKYKVVNPGVFAFDTMSVIRVHKVPIILNTGNVPVIISPAYITFVSNDENVLDSNYLRMWVRRQEFDRYADFKSDAAVRGGYGWDELCDTLIRIPTIEEQRRIVAEYQAVEKRIATNERLIAILEETAQTIYKKMFIDDIDQAHLPDGWHKRQLVEVAAIKGGKRLPKGEELVDNKTSHPYIKVADMPKCRYIQLTDSFQYVTDEIQDSIKRYIVNEGDVIISIVGTIGNVNIIGHSLDGANLTENCMKICQNQGYTNLIYSFLTSDEGKRQIEQGTVGGVQGKLPMYNVEKLELVIPNADGLRTFNDRIDIINNRIKSSRSEILLLQQMSDLLLSKLS